MRSAVYAAWDSKIHARSLGLELFRKVRDVVKSEALTSPWQQPRFLLLGCVEAP